MVSLTEQIKQKALEIGFHKVGIVRAEPLCEEGERLKEWLANDYHGEMRWMEREPEKRYDPRLIFPEARSMVVVALNYFTPHEHEETDAKGKVSRYAWGDDYHDVLKEKLRELLAFIKSIEETADGKICVDTAPVMDKAWAVRAGLGWIGKHSNVITKEYGSWIFIGEVLLNLELDYESKIINDYCGTCTMCLDACPTGAIVAPYIVDSNRCLSYATIESRAPDLPSETSENLNGWLYGCDICQDVCPWNRFEKPTEEARFEPRAGNVSADLEEILALSPEEYAARFRRSAMKRAKLGGLQRNARALKVKR
ncbi:MAG: Epoxyqueuosine reductase [uncultured Pyrinomonadaceae bacterium]|uniref:Epoxyqueuosine reductase n=1 Tax=uncultured Pyrinomonadaceae bacterium TaxID=2283094 RepID=A0A6J4P9P6_9BACT|nr:MAG: Epoxyqueuosine reductase [uncultured Pyrinomonadaceae bacterium]